MVGREYNFSLVENLHHRLLSPKDVQAAEPSCSDLQTAHNSCRVGDLKYCYQPRQSRFRHECWATSSGDVEPRYLRSETAVGRKKPTLLSPLPSGIPTEGKKPGAELTQTQRSQSRRVYWERKHQKNTDPSYKSLQSCKNDCSPNPACETWQRGGHRDPETFNPHAAFAELGSGFLAAGFPGRRPQSPWDTAGRTLFSGWWEFLGGI